MMMKRVALLVPFLFTTLACVRSPGPTGPPEVTALYGGPLGYELVRIPALAHVEQYRVAARNSAATRPVIGNAAILAGPVRPDDATLKALSDVLCRKETFDFGVVKKCEFNPDVALRFAGARRTLDLVFCFTCGDVIAFQGERLIGQASFDPAKAELRALLRPDAGDAAR
jgi:hypothetical protein